MKLDIKSRKGFTLIELLVVIGILAVLAAIAIPSVAGLIDRANVSADKTNSNEMTNAMERFASEYELFCQDIASGTFDKDNMDATQGRVYNVLGIEDRAGIELVEIDADEPVDDDDIAIYRDTKYPANAKTAQLIVQNYTKTSSSTFEPKQSDMHYWYSPDCGVIVYAEPNAGLTPENIVNKLNAQVISGMDAKGNPLDENTEWIDLTLAYSIQKSIQNEDFTLTEISWNVDIYGYYVWRDGANTYYSKGTDQYVLKNGVWEEKAWNGLNSFDGDDIWTDGTNIYYSDYSKQYVLNGDTWMPKTWTGISEGFDGSDIWNYNGNTYVSTMSSSRKLVDGVWSRCDVELASRITYPTYVWTDGTNTYYSYYTTQYIIKNGKLEAMRWEGMTNFNRGSMGIWTNGKNIYYTSDGMHYVLRGNTWVEKELNVDLFYSSGVWTDGTNYYHSGGGKHYKIS